METIPPFSSILGLYLLYRLVTLARRRLPGNGQHLHAAALTIALGVFVLPAYTLTIRNYQGITTRLDTAKGSVYVSDNMAREIGGALELIKTDVPSSEALLIIPRDPVLYYLTDRPNVTRYDFGGAWRRDGCGYRGIDCDYGKA